MALLRPFQFLALASLGSFGLAALQSPSASPLESRQAASVPQYVIDNAPLVRITSGDPYQPADIAAQLTNTSPKINLTAIDASAYPSPLTLDNLDSLNDVPNSAGGNYTYLSANDNFASEPPPQWLQGTAPDSSGTTNGAVSSSSTSSAAEPSDTCLEERQNPSSPSAQQQVSSAIIVYDHQDDAGTVDAFYFYFYAFDQGPAVDLFGVMSYPLGCHVGDWEHNMIRFTNGEPQAIWYSQHSFGEAFSFNASGLQKQQGRPISYSANGSHANYATSGSHFYAIPEWPIPGPSPLQDHTDDQGNLWDPTKSAYFYSVTFPSGSAATDDSNPTFTALTSPNSQAGPTNWLNYNGQWGDDQIPDSDPRQMDTFFGVTRYVAGPNGPKFKQLRRAEVCTTGHDCVVKDVVLDGA
ncbi:MAG: hypothetical protein Q9162_004456 [Coniocarpon cinnabarinum]